MRLEPVATGAALILQQLVVERESTDEHSNVRAGQAVCRDSRIFERLPRGVQQEALLRIERVRLARGDAEELRVELIDLTEESASAGDDLADLRRIRIMITRSVPTCFGNDAGGVGLAAQQVPEAFRGIGTAWKTTSDAHDGQRLPAAVLSFHGQLD